MSLKDINFTFGERRSLLLNNHLRDRDFTDVTIVTTDMISVQAHKIVLGSFSELFRNMLMKVLPQSNPIFVLPGINSTELQLIMSFLYNGECQVPEEHLGKFLQIGHNLQINGLSEYQIDGNLKESDVTEHDGVKDIGKPPQNVINPLTYPDYVKMLMEKAINAVFAINKVEDTLVIPASFDSNHSTTNLINDSLELVENQALDIYDDESVIDIIDSSSTKKYLEDLDRKLESMISKLMANGHVQFVGEQMLVHHT